MKDSFSKFPLSRLALEYCTLRFNVASERARARYEKETSRKRPRRFPTRVTVEVKLVLGRECCEICIYTRVLNLPTSRIDLVRYRVKVATRRGNRYLCRTNLGGKEIQTGISSINMRSVDLFACVDTHNAHAYTVKYGATARFEVDRRSELREVLIPLLYLAHERRSGAERKKRKREKRKLGADTNVRGEMPIACSNKRAYS